MSSVINATTTSGIQVTADNSGSLQLATNNGTTAITVDTSQNVGVGLSSPGARLDVNAGSLGTTSGNSVEIARFTNQNTNGSNIRFYQYRNANGNDWTTASTRIQQRIDATDMGYIEFNPINGTQALAFGTSNLERMRIDGAGALILAGSTAQKATGTTWSNPSDLRLKDNITSYSKGLTELMQVEVKTWEYNGKGGTVEGTKGLGVIADEIMQVLPDTVENYQAKLNADDEEVTDIKKFDATEITWLLVNAIKEQQAIITNLTARIDALENK